MAIQERLRFELDFASLPLPPLPKVIEVVVEDYVDNDGEDSLRAWIVIAADTSDDSLTGEAVGQIKNAVWDHVRSLGHTRFLYTRLVPESERPWLLAEEPSDD